MVTERPGAHALVERRRGSYEKRKLLELQKRREEDDNATTDNLKPVNDTDAEKKRGKTIIHSKTITSESKCDNILMWLAAMRFLCLPLIVCSLILNVARMEQYGT